MHFHNGAYRIRKVGFERVMQVDTYLNLLSVRLPESMHVVRN
jgi:hypothetical protein